MDTQNTTKLQKLLYHLPPGMVATSSWLTKLEISKQLTQNYIIHNWIEPLGYGAYKRPHDQVEWYGALSSIQQQTGLLIHAGGPTAITLNGVSHYLRMHQEDIFLYAPLNIHLPKWFYEHDWRHRIIHIKTSQLPPNIGIKTYDYHGTPLKISSVERAILECLYLAPQKFDLLECYQIVEGLMNLRPYLIQELLENCNSVKVKRLFLYMSEKAQLPIMKHLKLKNINLGTGDRTIAKNGSYNQKYGLILPKELIDYA